MAAYYMTKAETLAGLPPITALQIAYQAAYPATVLRVVEGA
jgi:hypothetical protein